jgi:hypothetical protein
MGGCLVVIQASPYLFYEYHTAVAPPVKQKPRSRPVIADHRVAGVGKLRAYSFFAGLASFGFVWQALGPRG